MNILIMTGPLWPQKGNNANLLWKLLPFLKKDNTFHLLAIAPPENSELPPAIDGIPVTWCRPGGLGVAEQWLVRWKDRGGYSDAIIEASLKRTLRQVQSEFRPDAVVATMEPFPSAHVAMTSNIPCRVLYIMDPPEHLAGNPKSGYRRKSLPAIVHRSTRILTTPFIKEAICADGLSDCSDKITAVGFPMVDAQTVPTETGSADTEKIKLLFCGWLYSEIRSPRYFLDIVERLDERFEITFMGKECDKLPERFSIETKAEICTLPQQPYNEALRAMAGADVLINIGNSVPVHMPSKTLEYINTGKPFVNFYKWDECPTLYYTKRYPLCLNVPETNPDTDAAAETFIRFCEQSKGKTANRATVLREYADCTPEHIADLILREIKR